MPTESSRRIASACLCSPLRFLHRAISRIYDEALRPFGVGIAHVNLLVAIEELGEHATGPVVGAALQLEKSSLSREVRALEARGWVRRLPGRGAAMELTSDGRKLLQRVVPSWERAQKQAAELLGDTGLDMLMLARDLRSTAVHEAR